MAVPTFLGTVTVWGIDGTMAYTGMATTDNLLERMELEDNVDEHESKDKQGEVIGLKLFNPRANITIDFYPAKAAGTGSVAGAKQNVLLPAKGSKVTFATMAELTAGAIPAMGAVVAQLVNASTWLYVGGGRIAYTNTGEVKMTLPLRRYATDIAATPNT